MTSSEFLEFWTPSLPLVSTKSTQPSFLLSDFGQPPPPLPKQTSFVHRPNLKPEIVRRNIDSTPYHRLPNHSVKTEVWVWNPVAEGNLIHSDTVWWFLRIQKIYIYGNPRFLGTSG